MEENKKASATKKSSEQPELQQDVLKTEEVGEDQQNLQHKTSAHSQQSVESHSSSKVSSSDSGSVLLQLLNATDQATAQQAYLASDKRPCSSKQAQQSSSLQSMQGEKRRSDGLSEQHSQSKQFRQPDDGKEEKKTKEEKEETEKSDSKSTKE